jgi:hypothetical protein
MSSADDFPHFDTTPSTPNAPPEVAREKAAELLALKEPNPRHREQDVRRWRSEYLDTYSSLGVRGFQLPYDTRKPVTREYLG